MTNANRETTMTKAINVTTTPYEGEDFPEAASYPEFVAKRLADMYKAKVEVSEGPTTRVFLYGFDQEGLDDGDLVNEIKAQVKVDLWDEFCAHGYKDYSDASA